jgi:hypothetical protein
MKEQTSEVVAPKVAIEILEYQPTVDPMEGKRCISCGKLVPKKHWHLPKDDVMGCGLRPLCEMCR